MSGRGQDLGPVRRDSGDLGEALGPHREVEGGVRTTESVLDRLQNSTAAEVRVLLLDGEVKHGVDHVLELLGASHLAVLGHLANDDDIDVVLLAVVSQHAERALRRAAVRLAVCVVAVIHALERVDDQEERTTSVPGTDSVTRFEQRRDVRLLADAEAVAKAEALSDHFDLIETLLGRVEDHRRAGTSETVGQRQHHGRLAGARRTSEQSSLAGRETLTAEGAVKVVQIRPDLVLERIRNLDVNDVLTKGDILTANVELHSNLLLVVVAFLL